MQLHALKNRNKLNTITMKKITASILSLCLLFAGCTKDNNLPVTPPAESKPANTSVNQIAAAAQPVYGTEMWILLGSPVPAGWVTVRSSGTSVLIRKV